ncbi:hypothetical protein MKY96_10090 [Paenibacillus sp. FSL R7-0302]|uniref:hypothetical protein n=1 Tax=Paenibacillus sp. FSL R7-0302 TaxID=2921681 RepID=UPI0030F647DA
MGENQETKATAIAFSRVVPSACLLGASLLHILQDLTKKVSGCGTLLHHLQEFRGLEQVSAGFVAFHAGFQHRSFLLVRIVAFHAGFH